MSFAWFWSILTEIGLITPPIGLNLYVLQGMSKKTLDEVSLGAFLFALLMLVGLALITVFTQIAIWLPGHMK